MITLIAYLFIPAFVWNSFRKCFYDGILYGLIHKKVGGSIGSVRFRPYLYAGQAKCRGWGLISPGVVLLIVLIFLYTVAKLYEQQKVYFHSINNYYVINLVEYRKILGYLYFE